MTSEMGLRVAEPCAVSQGKLPLFPAVFAHREWYAVHTRARHEKTVMTQLEQDGIEALLPTFTQARQWSDRRKVVSLPLFSGYVFVRVSFENGERLRVLRKAGVLGFVGCGRRAVPIPEEQMESVVSLMEEPVDYGPYPYLTVGRRVRIREGALKGLEGILLRVDDQQSLVLSIDLIQRSVKVRIEGYALEPV